MITTENEYNAIIARIEELLKNPENIENQDSEGYVLLNSLSDLVTDYEQVHFPIQEIEKE